MIMTICMSTHDNLPQLALARSILTRSSLVPRLTS